MCYIADNERISLVHIFNQVSQEELKAIAYEIPIDNIEYSTKGEMVRYLIERCEQKGAFSRLFTAARRYIDEDLITELLFRCGPSDINWRLQLDITHTGAVNLKELTEAIRISANVQRQDIIIFAQTQNTLMLVDLPIPGAAKLLKSRISSPGRTKYRLNSIRLYSDLNEEELRLWNRYFADQPSDITSVQQPESSGWTNRRILKEVKEELSIKEDGIHYSRTEIYYDLPMVELKLADAAISLPELLEMYKKIRDAIEVIDSSPKVPFSTRAIPRTPELISGQLEFEANKKFKKSGRKRR